MTGISIPERFSLLQAAIWLLRKEPPISESNFAAARKHLTPEEVSTNNRAGDLVRALHGGRLASRASLGGRKNRDFYFIYAKPCRPSDPAHFDPSQTDKHYDMPVPANAWRFDEVVWNHSALSMYYDQIPEEVEAAERQPTVYSRDDIRSPYFWHPISVSGADLLRAFPELQADEPSKRPAKPGPHPKYDWEAMYVYLAITADLDGLPEKQSDCERLALDWFAEQGLSPSESTLREKVSPLYNHPRRVPERMSRGRGRN